MKKILFLSTAVVITFLFSVTSCKKKGCTDEVAINYFSKVKEDDGSCSFSTTRIAGEYTYTWNDTITDTATVYSLGKSLLKVDGKFWHYGNYAKHTFLVTWSDKSMYVHDTLTPFFAAGIDPFPGSNPSEIYRSKITGTIVSKDHFTVFYKQEIPTWNNVSLKKDTTFTYEFNRI